MAVAAQHERRVELLQRLQHAARVSADVRLAPRVRDGHEVAMQDDDREIRLAEPVAHPSPLLAAHLPVVEVRLGGVQHDEVDAL